MLVKGTMRGEVEVDRASLLEAAKDEMFKMADLCYGTRYYVDDDVLYELEVWVDGLGHVHTLGPATELQKAVLLVCEHLGETP